MADHTSDGFEFIFNFNVGNTTWSARYETAEEEAQRKEKERQKDLPQFLKPGYKIIDDPNPNYLNFWRPFFQSIEMETVQIEQ